MKKYSLTCLACLICLSLACNVQASELFGRISTDPNDVYDKNSNSPSENNSSQTSVSTEVPASGGSVFSPTQKNEKPQIEPTLKLMPKTNITKDQIDETSKVKVLGVSHFADGVLIRGQDKKIFVIENQTRKYICSLSTLQKYRGQEILNLKDDELNEIPFWKHKEGELIRQAGTEKVYVIEQGKKRHILSIEELRSSHSGKEIFNLSFFELKLYSD